MMAWLQNEKPAADKVRQMLEDAERGRLQLRMNIVNVGEVFYLVYRRRGPAMARALLAQFKTMPLAILPAPNKLVMEASEIKGRYPVSYADAFAVATAIREHARLVTGDPELRVLQGRGVVELEWLQV